SVLLRPPSLGTLSWLFAVVLEFALKIFFVSFRNLYLYSVNLYADSIFEVFYLCFINKKTRKRR
ncbi:hypothetical protein GLOIN_2v1560324, partial [Rhizophagus irregularis DAOM 181602=DAOM 197198]